MAGSTAMGVLAILVAVGVFVLVGLFYLGGRREGPPNGSDRGR
ncbi:MULTISPECIES: hypothetical protein [Actinomadura]|uniref:Uncharacterized protein n=1 Tax=Actinomadura madurae TaxID=1993 RepID=A0A1I5HC84_9ACTN|nr:hypothetical protein [Actinomadura madurae]SFO45799.1 hypothetical protein SAMN04489713_106137 [Actinomadura madurae]SPT57666.1 Uncharacterised protein [Actinomadura madurae]